MRGCGISHIGEIEPVCTNADLDSQLPLLSNPDHPLDQDKFAFSKDSSRSDGGGQHTMLAVSNQYEAFCYGFRISTVTPLLRRIHEREALVRVKHVVKRVIHKGSTTRVDESLGNSRLLSAFQQIVRSFNVEIIIKTCI